MTVLNTALFLVPLLIAVREIVCQSFQLISVCGTELVATPISHRPTPSFEIFSIRPCYLLSSSLASSVKVDWTCSRNRFELCMARLIGELKS